MSNTGGTTRAVHSSARKPGGAASTPQAPTKRPWRSKIPPPALDPRVEQLIRELFELIDDDGDGSITLPKLAAALRASDVHLSKPDQQHLFRAVDLNCDGVLVWDEFHTFFAWGVHAGQEVLLQDFAVDHVRLPVMDIVQKLGRRRVLREVEAGGDARAAAVERAVHHVAMLSDEVKQLHKRKNPHIWRSQRILNACACQGRGEGSAPACMLRRLRPPIHSVPPLCSGCHVCSV